MRRLTARDAATSPEPLRLRHRRLSALRLDVLSALSNCPGSFEAGSFSSCRSHVNGHCGTRLAFTPPSAYRHCDMGIQVTADYRGLQAGFARPAVPAFRLYNRRLCRREVTDPRGRQPLSARAIAVAASPPELASDRRESADGAPDNWCRCASSLPARREPAVRWWLSHGIASSKPMAQRFRPGVVTLIIDISLRRKLPQHIAA